MADSGQPPERAVEKDGRVELCGKCPLRAKEFALYAYPSIYVPKIDKNIPIPQDGLEHDRRRRLVSLPVYGMKVGDSVWHPWPWDAIKRPIDHLTTTRGWKFTHRMMGIGTRVWRIK